MIKKLIYEWLLSWMTMHDIIYLISKITQRDGQKKVKFKDNWSDGRKMTGEICWTTTK